MGRGGLTLNLKRFPALLRAALDICCPFSYPVSAGTGQPQSVTAECFERGDEGQECVLDKG